MPPDDTLPRGRPLRRAPCIRLTHGPIPGGPRERQRDGTIVAVFEGPERAEDAKRELVARGVIDEKDQPIDVQAHLASVAERGAPSAQGMSHSPM